MAYELGHIRTDQGLFWDKGNQVYDVRHKDFEGGAKGDGATNDAPAINAAITAANAAGGGTVYVPGPATYAVDVSSGVGINLKSNVTLHLGTGAVLQAIACGVDYFVLQAEDVSDVAVSGFGATIQGERDSHTVETGETGHGIGYFNVTRGLIEGVTCKDGWGDGIYIGGSGVAGNNSTDVTVRNVVTDNNRRNSISITGLIGGLVENCELKNTDGFDPQAGIDLEPNSGRTNRDIVIRNNRVSGNTNDGIQVQGSLGTMDNILIEGNMSADNGLHGIYLTQTGGVTIRGNHCRGNTGNGVYINAASPGVRVEGNDCTDNDTGIILYGSNEVLVSGNTCRTNTSHGIQIYISNDSVVKGNIVRDNGMRGVYIQASGDSNRNIIRGNHISGNLTGVYFASTPGENNEVSGNYVYENEGDGMSLGPNAHATKVHDNYVYGNSTDTDNTANGITVAGDYTSVQGNVVRDGDPNRHAGGIEVSGTGPLVLNNDLYDSGATFLLKSSGATDPVAANNRGVDI